MKIEYNRFLGRIQGHHHMVTGRSHLVVMIKCDYVDYNFVTNFAIEYQSEEITDCVIV